MKDTALITGASSGIGIEFSRLLARADYDIILTGRNADALKKTQKSIEKETGTHAGILIADLSKPEAAAKLYKTIKKRKTGVGILINCAGSGLFGESVSLNHQDAEKMLQLNISSLTTLCTLFGADMAARKNGYILNVGSLAGNQPTPFFASYAASKSYVFCYSLALHAELKDKGVSVCCLQPGYVHTAFDNNAGIKSKRYKDFSRRNGMEPGRVAEIGLNALFRNTPYVIAGWKNRITAVLSFFMPKAALAWILYRSVKKMTEK
ncbi:MAG: SDR family NAD(P)-dependent oxidoreductase [Spirochaetota bacterium]